MTLAAQLPAGRYVVAVSGGVDSVVLLDVLAKQRNLELIVAHFDHGIRSDSRQDAIFVRNLAGSYNLKFEMRREELGASASEELARGRRYAFLREVTERNKAKLVTAHHNDDVIETIVINLIRGTGWRGLAVLDSDVVRPLTNYNKADILDYAKENELIWHEDSTNASNKYLRNRLRKRVLSIDRTTKGEITKLWIRQKELKRQIDNEVSGLVDDSEAYDRYFYIFIDEISAIECLRHITKSRLTRPQMMKMLYMIKTAKPSKKYQAGGNIEVSFTSRNFMIKMLK